jgi:hypothetical protein
VERKAALRLLQVMSRAPDFDAEFDRLLRNAPKWLRRPLKNARRPGAAWARIPLALGLIFGGILGFLPILGFWMLPLGLAVLAVDLPFMQGPLARLLAMINRKLAAA